MSQGLLASIVANSADYKQANYENKNVYICKWYVENIPNNFANTSSEGLSAFLADNDLSNLVGEGPI